MNFKESIEKLKRKLPKSKSSFLIMLGVIGLLLVLVSSFDFNKNENIITQDESVKSSSEYTTEIESKLSNIISDMLGKTEVSVMVTLECGIEYVYADEVKTDADVTKDQSAYKTQQSDSNHKTYIVIKDSDGNEKPLVVTEKMPVIRGVVVVCNGGETEAVASAVKLAVCSALNVENEKICIIGRH